jgi:hypothetical protein
MRRLAPRPGGGPVSEDEQQPLPVEPLDDGAMLASTNEDRVYVQVLDAEFGLVAVWGEHLAARMPAIGGIPAVFQSGGVVSHFLNVTFPDLTDVAASLDGHIYRVDVESQAQLASGKVFKGADTGARFPQIHTPGERDARFVRLEDLDLSSVYVAAAEMEETQAEIEAAYALLVDQFNEELQRANDEIARLHRQLDSLVRHQLVTEWASMETDFVELVDMIAVVASGEKLTDQDFAALREAVRHAHASVIRARGELQGFFELAKDGMAHVGHFEPLRASLADPMMAYWLQSYARGQVQLMLARSLLLYGDTDHGPAREGQLRQRIFDQSRMWTADVDSLTRYAESLLDVESLGWLRRRKPKQVNALLRDLRREVKVIAAPLETTWAGLPAAVGVKLPGGLVR